MDGGVSDVRVYELLFALPNPPTHTDQRRGVMVAVHYSMIIPDCYVSTCLGIEVECEIRSQSFRRLRLGVVQLSNISALTQ